MIRSAMRLACVFFMVISRGSIAATYFVAPDGNDSLSGTIESPFATWGKAQSMVDPGDTALFRGGTYAIQSDTDTVGIRLDKPGNLEKSIHYWAYGEETPVFDFAGLKAASQITGILVTASYLHIKSMEMRGVPQSDLPSRGESWCIRVNGGLINGTLEGGTKNIFERLNLHHNMGTGFYLAGGFMNLILNCDSHHNFDPHTYVKGVKKPGANADGFAAHMSNSFNMANYFRGCRAWLNSDAGFDASGSNSTAYFDTCWSWSNGYYQDSVRIPGLGDGFRMGGFDKLIGATVNCACHAAHYVRFSLAFWNGLNGFTQNQNHSASRYYNNTGFGNFQSNFSGTGFNGNNLVQIGIFRNNLSIGSSLSMADSGEGRVLSANNSWSLADVKVDSLDFQSMDTTGVSGPRLPDGRLPILPFLKLVSGSDLIDKGADLEFSYSGSAPDLGAFETEIPTRILHPVSKARSPIGNVGILREAEIDAAGRQKANLERSRKNLSSK